MADFQLKNIFFFGIHNKLIADGIAAHGPLQKIVHGHLKLAVRLASLGGSHRAGRIRQPLGFVHVTIDDLVAARLFEQLVRLARQYGRSKFGRIETADRATAQTRFYKTLAKLHNQAARTLASMIIINRLFFSTAKTNNSWLYIYIYIYIYLTFNVNSGLFLCYKIVDFV